MSRLPAWLIARMAAASRRNHAGITKGAIL
jgi:hypothetical protein